MKLNQKNPYIKQALDVLAPLKLDNVVHPDRLRLNDAANYLARILDENIEDPPVAQIMEHLGVPPENTAFAESVAAALAKPKADEKIAERLKIEAECKANPALVKKHLDRLKKWAHEDLEETAAAH